MARGHNTFTAQLPQESDAMKAEKTRFYRWLADKKSKGEKINVAYGALHEKREGANAFIEEYIYPEAGGTELKLWGISYRLKLSKQGHQLHAFDLAKSMISEIPREVIGENKWLAIPLGLMVLSSKKRTIRMLDRLFTVLITRNLRWLGLEHGYNPVPREVQRACFAVLKRYGFDAETYTVFTNDPEKYDFPAWDGTWQHLMACVSVLVAYFLEVDTAYRFRVQDAFSKDLFTMLDTLISREAGIQGVGHKWQWLKRALRVILWRYPDIDNFIKDVLLEVDAAKMKLDDADLYFCLGYISYNFGGISYEERWRIRKLADKEKDHIIFYA